MSRKQPRRSDRPGVDRYGRTPLHGAAADGAAVRCRELLAAGAAPDAQDDEGWTALHFAAQAVAADVVALLLQAGADPERRDAHGNSALWRAVFAARGDGAVISLLRGAGADAAAANRHGVTPAGLARSIANFDLARYFEGVPP